MAGKKNISSAKRNSLMTLVITLVILVLINILGQFFFQRFDLTTDKRYSLNDATKKQLESLEDVIFVRVYLDGDLPAGFRRLRDATRELLDEMRVYAGDNLQYEFINPSASPDAKEREKVYRELSKAGLKYTNLMVREGDKNSEQIIFPGAIISYRETEYPVQLLKSSIGLSTEAILNNSIQQLEYEFSSTIKKATEVNKKRIAIIRGQGEATGIEMMDITRSLAGFYNVDTLNINGKYDALKLYQAIIVAGPSHRFTEKDKYVIDQFVMRGGKVLWFVDGVEVNSDSLQKNGITMALMNDVNLSDMLFKYGCRINPNVILDLNSLPIPVVTGMVGDKPRQEMFPWFYFPLIFNTVDHPITKNLDAIITKYVSSIDTVGGKGIKKTVLLKTSPKSRVNNAPTRISLNILRVPPDERRYNQGPYTIGVLLEGQFRSVFKNRLPKIENNPTFKFRDISEPTKMIVISDADVIKNEVDRRSDTYFDLGYYKYTKRVYGNKDFVMNCVNYLLDEDGLINARAKDFKLRLLDRPRVQKEKKKWQIINTAIPILFVILFAFGAGIIRKRKYTRF